MLLGPLIAGAGARRAPCFLRTADAAAGVCESQGPAAPGAELPQRLWRRGGLPGRLPGTLQGWLNYCWEAVVFLLVLKFFMIAVIV